MLMSGKILKDWYLDQAPWEPGSTLELPGRPEIASKHFPQMLNQFREHEKLSLVVYYAGLSASKQKDWNNAANHFKRVTEKHPKSEKT